MQDDKRMSEMPKRGRRARAHLKGRGELAGLGERRLNEELERTSGLRPRTHEPGLPRLMVRWLRRRLMALTVSSNGRFGSSRARPLARFRGSHPPAPLCSTPFTHFRDRFMQHSHRTRTREAREMSRLREMSAVARQNRVIFRSGVQAFAQRHTSRSNASGEERGERRIGKEREDYDMRCGGWMCSRGGGGVCVGEAGV